MSDAVQLEPWGEDDLPLLRRLTGDPVMMEHLGGAESPEKIAERNGRYAIADSGQFKIVDGASGAGGELWVRGPQVMRGYLGDEVATLATIDADGWLRTGDLVRFFDDGNLFVVDRLKELIKVRGYHVAPAQLEAELAAHPAVADAAVVPRPDEESGEVPVAYVELHGTVEPGELAAWVAERVAPYKRLADVVVVDAIPRAPTGKLLRRVLVERERAAPVA